MNEMISKLNIRKAQGADAEIIDQLARIIWNYHYPTVISQSQIDYMLEKFYSPDVVRSSMEAGEEFYLAFLEDSLVAYASYTDKEQYYFLNKFYVDVSKHRLGIGNRFLSFLFEKMVVEKPVKLQVNRKNVKAINFYCQNGFAIEEAKDFPIGNNYLMEDFIMVRKSCKPL